MNRPRNFERDWYATARQPEHDHVPSIGVTSEPPRQQSAGLTPVPKFRKHLGCHDQNLEQHPGQDVARPMLEAETGGPDAL
jgi:hypothetical protein